MGSANSVTPLSYDQRMALPVPTSLSPSRVDAFTSCPLAFRFAAIDKLPEPPSPAAAKGTLVHRALELLFEQAPTRRTLAIALGALERAKAWLDGYSAGARLEGEAGR